MIARTLSVALMFALAGALVACSGADEPDTDTDTSTGSQLAPGLYDLEDGTAQAVGTLQWLDLEGGFWALVEAPAPDGEPARTVAVIANGAEMQAQLEPLEGRVVSIVGERFDGASIRMAGPEIIADTIEEVDDGS